MVKSCSSWLVYFWGRNQVYSARPNVYTTPIKAIGCRQCLPISIVQMNGKHCRKPHCRNGVVNTFLLYSHGKRGNEDLNFILLTTLKLLFLHPKLSYGYGILTWWGVFQLKSILCMTCGTCFKIYQHFITWRVLIWWNVPVLITTHIYFT